jgi:23S rRNA pseudouridine955/2504/2580 synthase
VLFGKTAAALKDLNTMIREDMVDKYYLTIVSGIIDEEMRLTGTLVKDERSNKVRVSQVSGESAAGVHRFAAQGVSHDSSSRDTDSGRGIITVVKPLEHFRINDTSGGKAGARRISATLAEIHLVTGRPHQIRAHLASIGHPVIGDAKYADRTASGLNEYAKKRFGLTTQLLHARRIEFRETTEELAYLCGRSFEAEIPPRFRNILTDLRNSGR